MPRRKNSQHRIDYMVNWSRENQKQFKVSLKLEEDSDIIEHLNTIPNKAEYIRKLIRADMKEPSLKN